MCARCYAILERAHAYHGSGAPYKADTDIKYKTIQRHCPACKADAAKLYLLFDMLFLSPRLLFSTETKAFAMPVLKYCEVRTEYYMWGREMDGNWDTSRCPRLAWGIQYLRLVRRMIGTIISLTIAGRSHSQKA